MSTPLLDAATLDQSVPTPASLRRIASIDAVRGLVMFSMIYVNDIAGVSSKIVPGWMRHYKGRSGMTFVDLVFPAFLFIVGMSIPIALGSRLNKGEPVWKILFHVIIRTLALLFIGILMVNGSPSSSEMGWSATAWEALMYLSAIFAFCSISTPWKSEPGSLCERICRVFTLILRVLGFASLIYLAFVFRGGRDGHRIINLSPFSIHTEWYGILGLIGWAYLVASIVFLCFRNHRTALLGCTVLLFCLYPADKTGAFENFWLSHYVGIGGSLGTHAAISAAGLLLATILLTPDTITAGSRAKFTLLFIAGCTIGALLLNGLYGINKPQATPSWCLWTCAITAAIWLVFYFLSDVLRQNWLTKPFSIAGENVLLAYLLHNMFYPALDLFHLDDWYSHLAQPDLFHAVARSIGCGIVILSLSAVLNRIGFRLKL